MLTRGADGRPEHVEIVDYAVVPSGAEDGLSRVEERSAGVYEKR